MDCYYYNISSSRSDSSSINILWVMRACGNTEMKRFFQINHTCEECEVLPGKGKKLQLIAYYVHH